uniref:Uncharacterized protein n=1 Tax=Anguilla anguilla TaxID=7936 RepID=A0A0E9VBC3_ANGAN
MSTRDWSQALKMPTCDWSEPLFQMTNDLLTRTCVC